ncbi:14730_t:CDS:2, partial [Gigaspora rosea]
RVNELQRNLKKTKTSYESEQNIFEKSAKSSLSLSGNNKITCDHEMMSLISITNQDKTTNTNIKIRVPEGPGIEMENSHTEAVLTTTTIMDLEDNGNLNSPDTGNRWKLREVANYKQRLREYYTFEKLLNSYFMLPEKKKPLSLIPQELNPHVQSLFPYIPKNSDDFRKHIVEEVEETESQQILPDLEGNESTNYAFSNNDITTVFKQTPRFTETSVGDIWNET